MSMLFSNPEENFNMIDLLPRDNSFLELQYGQVIVLSSIKYKTMV